MLEGCLKTALPRDSLAVTLRPGTVEDWAGTVREWMMDAGCWMLVDMLTTESSQVKTWLAWFDMGGRYGHRHGIWDMDVCR